MLAQLGGRTVGMFQEIYSESGLSGPLASAATLSVCEMNIPGWENAYASLFVCTHTQVVYNKC